jgi:hypothetical protein
MKKKRQIAHESIDIMSIYDRKIEKSTQKSDKIKHFIKYEQKHGLPPENYYACLHNMERRIHPSLDTEAGS